MTDAADRQPAADRHSPGRGGGGGTVRRAATSTSTPTLFFPAAESGPARDAQVAAAKAVCARCPVRAECLTEALLRIPYGIAGGLTEHERRQLRRDHPEDRRGGPGGGRGARRRATAGMTARERAGVGRMLLAAGRSTRQVAGDCGVCPRTAERWATTSPTSTSPTSAGPTSTSGMSGGAGEGSRGGHRAPLRISTAQHAQAGTRAPEGHRG